MTAQRNASSQAAEAAWDEELTLAARSFKRFILAETAAFESEPRADLFRVEVLSKMLSQCRAQLAQGTQIDAAIIHVMKRFSGLETQMRKAGFAEREDSIPSRWERLSEAEVTQFIQESRNRRHRIALGAAFCAGCCFPLMAAIGLADLIGLFEETLMALLGLLGMFGMIGMGVYLFLTTKKPSLAAKVHSGRYSLGAKLRRKLKDLRPGAQDQARRRIALGVVLEVLCIAPLLLGAIIDYAVGSAAEAMLVLGVAGMFAMVAAGVYELVVSNGEKNAIEKLIRMEECE